MQPETIIRNAILERLSALTWNGQRACVVWRRFVGKTRALTDPRIVITIGTPGMADIGGFLCTGRAIEVEVKTQTGRLSQEQQNWARVCQAMGALHIVARTPEDAEKAVLDALAS